MVLHGDFTRKLRTFGPFAPLPPINHFRKGNRTPAMSKIDVKVFSRINAETYNAKTVANLISPQTNKKSKSNFYNKTKFVLYQNYISIKKMLCLR